MSDLESLLSQLSPEDRERCRWDLDYLGVMAVEEVDGPDSNKATVRVPPERIRFDFATRQEGPE
jgi:hypothetical protein